MAHEPLPPPPRRRRRRHWARTLLRAVAVLIVLAIVAVQVALWSPLPRHIAETQVQKELGAAATIESVSVGWLGTTHAKNITLTQPMARTPVVQIRELTIRHDTLPLMPFTKHVQSITADGVELNLHQDREGEWNLLQLIKNRPPDEDKEPKAVLDLPNLTAEGVTVRLRTNDNRTAEMHDVQFSGIHKPPLDYVVAVHVGNELNAEGRMALTRDLSHELTLRLTRVPEQLKPILGKLPDPLRAQLTWTGRRTEHGIDGSLALADATAGNIGAAGEVELFTWENRLVAAPKSLAVRTLAPPTTRPTTSTTRPSETIVLDGGRILLGDRIGLQRLRASVGKGRFALDGYLDPRALTADLTAAWDEIAEAGLGSSGKATIRLTRDLTGGMSASIDIDGSVMFGDGTASGAVRIRGGGDSVETAFANIETDAITWSSPDGHELEFPAMEASLRASGRDLRLASLRPRDPALGDVSASGAFNVDSKFWFLSLSAHQLRLADLRVPGVHRPIDLNLDTFGTTKRLDVKDFYLRHGGAMYWSRGFYDSRLPDPVRFNAWAWYTLPRHEGDDTAFRGLRFQGDIAGTLNPRNLYARGSLRANDLQVRGRQIGDIAAYIEAHATDNEMTLDSPSDIELLGGKWKVHGRWDKSDRGERQPLVVRVDWTELPVSALADAAKLEGLFDGQIDAGTATITVPSARLREVQMAAQVHGSKLRILRPTRDHSEAMAVADALKLDAKLANGTLTADVKLTNGQGTIDSKIETTILEASPITVSSTVTEWPALTAKQSQAMHDLQTIVNGQVDVKVMPESKTVNSNAKLKGHIDRPDGNVSDFELSAYSANRKITLESLKMRKAHGSADGSGAVDLDDINAANLDLTFTNLDFKPLTWLVPQFADLSGLYSGELHLHPTTERRPLGPVEIKLNVAASGGHWRTIDVGDVELTAYGGYETPRDFRLVSDSALLHIAGGEVRPFVRLSSTTQYGLTQLLNVDVKDLNLEPMVHAFKEKDRKPMPGLVNGSIRMYGSLKSIAALNGEASIYLSKSDLVNFKPVSRLYDLMRVGTAGTKPIGEGRINFRVEQAVLRVNNAHYFNRGVEINAFGPIGKLDKLPDSPMDLMLVGSARPLKDLKLPFFGTADQILTVLQGAVTSVEAKGTLRNPETKGVAFSEFSDSMKELLLGVVQDDKQQ